MRHVPSYIDYIYKAARNTVEELIELTLDQAKARRLPVDDLESYHGDLYRYYNEFNALLQHIGKHHQLDSDTAETLRFNFECAIFEAYLLGSASPDPKCRDGKSRLAKAMKVRKKGWEEPVEKAIARAFKVASPNLPEDKDIIRMVHDEMKKLGIELTVGDEALRKRIRPHRKDAEYIAEHGAETDWEVPF